MSLCIQKTGVKLVQKLPYLKSVMSESTQAFLQVSRCPTCNILAMRHLPSQELLLALIRMVAAASRQPTSAKQRWVFSTQGGFDYVLRRYTEDIYDQSLPAESWLEGMKKTPFKSLYTAAQ